MANTSSLSLLFYPQRLIVLAKNQNGLVIGVNDYPFVEDKELEMILEKDFGEITQGTKVEHTFKFTNTGTEVLRISNVAATCGCTVPKWPKEPVAPGKTGEIKVSFNSAGKMGKQRSVVRIYSNASEPIEKVTLISNVTKSGK